MDFSVSDSICNRLCFSICINECFITVFVNFNLIIIVISNNDSAIFINSSSHRIGTKDCRILTSGYCIIAP